jgi:hypothetical protein
VRVECINCGGTDWVAIASFAVSLIGLVIAVVAAVLAKRAADSADASLVVAQDALAIAHDESRRSSVEHAEFMRQLQARARFEVTLRAVGADENGVFEASATEMNVRVEIGITNYEGDKAAGATIINVLVPEPTKGFRWSGPRGEELHTVSNVTLLTGETLTDADGKTFTSEFLSRELPRVTRRTAHVGYVSLTLWIPSEGEM